MIVIFQYRHSVQWFSTFLKIKKVIRLNLLRGQEIILLITYGIAIKKKLKCILKF